MMHREEGQRWQPCCVNCSARPSWTISRARSPSGRFASPSRFATVGSGPAARLIEGHIRLLSEYRNLAVHHGRAFGPSPGRIDLLNRALDSLRSLRDELFPHWQSADDLCQILIGKLTLPAERLSELAVKHPPPASWFEETIDPFSAD